MALAAKRGSRRHYAFVVVAMGALTVMGALGLARYPYSLILPTMKDALSLSYTEMGMLSTSFFVGYVVFALLTSMAATRLGARKVIFICMTVAGLGLAATGLAQGFAMALVTLTITGAATSGGYVQAMAMPSAWFSPKRRGMAAGAQVGGMGVGAVTSGFLIPMVLVAFGGAGWRYAWFFLGAAVLAIAMAGGVWYRNRPSDKGLLPFGPPEPPSSTPVSDAPLGKIYTSHLLWHTSAVYLLYGFTNIVVMTFFTAHLTKGLGLDTPEAGRAWAVMGTMTILSGFLWGFVSDRLGRKYGLALSLCFLGLGAALLGVSQGLPMIYVSGAIFGLCLTGAPSIIAAASGDYFGSRMAAPALGFLTVSFGLGQAFGPSLAGYIADLTGAFVIPFLLAGAASILAAGGALLLKK
ncbi:MAG: MFS transporter [Dehalococcoidia bacterium]|nr:MFS transporter [Dehalococcoidia bacterium]